MGSEGEEEEERGGEREVAERSGKNVTLQMVKTWVKSLEKVVHSKFGIQPWVRSLGDST